MRAATAAANYNRKAGENSGRLIAANVGAGRAARHDPAIRHILDVIRSWAEAVWMGYPTIELLQIILIADANTVASAVSPWNCSIGVAGVYLLNLMRIKWKPLSARYVVTHDNIKLGFMQAGPKAVAAHALHAARLWTDASSDFDGIVNWDAVQGLLASTNRINAHAKCSLKRLVSGGIP